MGEQVCRAAGGLLGVDGADVRTAKVFMIAAVLVSPCRIASKVAAVWSSVTAAFNSQRSRRFKRRPLA